MDKYYTEEEITQAITQACRTIDLLTDACQEYTRGVNDCLALLMEYDYELRGDKSKARDLIKFRWNSVKDFIFKLSKEGYSLKDYATYCGYEIITNGRPKVGDIAFDNGAMLHGGNFWVSTNEKNTGTQPVRQVMFLERKIPLIARPFRS